LKEVKNLNESVSKNYDNLKSKLTLDVNMINNIEASKDKLISILHSVNLINLNEDFLKMNAKQFLMANFKTLID